MRKVELGETLGQWVLNNRFIVIITSFLCALLISYGAKNLEFSSDYRYFFGADNPQRLAFEKLQNTYSNDDSVLIGIEPSDGVVFKTQTMMAIRDLTEQSWKVPFSTRVDSITNFQHTEAIGDELIVENLFSESKAKDNNLITNKFLDKIRNIAIKEPLLVNRIINKNADLTVNNITINLPNKSQEETPMLASHVRKMAKEFEEKYPGHKLYLSGIAMMNAAFTEAGLRDMQTLTPLMYGVILLIIFLLLKSFSSVIITFLVILLSILVGMGFGGWLNFPLTPPSSIAPIIIMTLAIADSIHILKSILKFMGKGLDKNKAIIESLKINLRPVFLTSFTTVIGFLSLNFSDTPPFHDLGNMTAIGVIAAFLYSILFLPAMVSLMPFTGRSSKEKSSQLLLNLAEFTIKNNKMIIFFFIILTVVLGYKAYHIKLNDQFVNYFDKTMEFRKNSEHLMNKLTGIYQVNFDMNTGQSQGVADPQFLILLEQFSNYLITLPGVIHVNTLSDTFKRLNKNMHGDDQAYYSLPQNRELASQYLLLYEMSLPYGLDLNNQIDIDKASTRVMVTMGNIESEQMLLVTEKGEQWLKENAPKSMHSLGTSPTIMFAHITERNVKSMFWGTLIAFFLITLTLIIALKSVRYGLISLIPNMIPAILAFGVWDILVGQVGFAIAVVASVTLGIVVDDTVHFLSKYARARKNGFSSNDSIREAFTGVGEALIVTSIILVVGFSVLMLSPFKINYVLGALSSMTIGIALLVDFTILPAVLSIVDSKK